MLNVAVSDNLSRYVT